MKWLNFIFRHTIPLILLVPFIFFCHVSKVHLVLMAHCIYKSTLSVFLAVASWMEWPSLCVAKLRAIVTVLQAVKTTAPFPPLTAAPKISSSMWLFTHIGPGGMLAATAAVAFAASRWPPSPSFPFHRATLYLQRRLSAQPSGSSPWTYQRA